MTRRVHSSKSFRLDKKLPSYLAKAGKIRFSLILEQRNKQCLSVLVFIASPFKWTQWKAWKWTYAKQENIQMHVLTCPFSALVKWGELLMLNMRQKLKGSCYEAFAYIITTSCSCKINNNDMNINIRTHF